MPELRGTRTAGLFLVIIVVLGISTVSAVTLSADNAKIPMIGGTTQVMITLDEVPEGIAGYNISLAVSDPDIAEITRIAPPIWAIPNKTSPLPSDRAWVTSIDFSRVVNPGDLDVVLATVTLHGLKTGKTDLMVSVIRIDDDKGYPVKPSVRSGTITIGDDSIPTLTPSDTIEIDSINPVIETVASGTSSVVISSISDTIPSPSVTFVENITTNQETTGISKGVIPDVTEMGNEVQTEKGIFEQILAFFRTLLGLK